MKDDYDLSFLDENEKKGVFYGGRESRERKEKAKTTGKEKKDKYKRGQGRERDKDTERQPHTQIERETDLLRQSCTAE